MVQLYVVRHGETETNHQGRINGFSTDLSLNDAGKKEVTFLANNMDINEFDEVYTSPLKRAKETAEILNNGVHEIKEDNRLQEINYGIWDGQPSAEIRDKYPDAFDENLFTLPNYIKYAKDGESFAHVYKRVNDFIKEMATKGDKKILIVCHGFISRAFYKNMTHVPDISSIIQPDNAGVAKYRINNGIPYVVYYNRVRDLDYTAMGAPIHG
ncbi:histidine phosphatase family protein [Companilactobacillus zhachilii]|uniref:histidine phosphatase family protein n=1 Tax=Companilactobacillus zhachilii TaxID=2304606 RepID=UPI004034E23B